MAKFDYYNSTARKRFYSEKTLNTATVKYLSIIAGFIVLFCLVLIFQPADIFKGFGQIILALALLFESIILSKKYATSPQKRSGNICDHFALDLIEAIEVTLDQAKKENFNLISAEYLFDKSSLSSFGNLFFIRLGLPSIQKARGQSNKIDVQFSPGLISLFESLASQEIITLADFWEKADQQPNVQQALDEFKIKPADFQKVIGWIRKIRTVSDKPRFWEEGKILSGIGQDWAYGYTPILSRFSYDLSRYFQDPSLKINVFGHTNKIDDIQTILAKPSKNNCLLVGEAGVGKKTVVNALASRLAQGDCLEPLKYKRIRQLDVGRLLAGADKGELAARLDGCFGDAVEAGNIILYLDNLESLLGGTVQATREEVGGIDATAILLPYLQNTDLRIIASITPDEYFERVRANSTLAGSFEKIDINPASEDDTLGILLDSLSYVEFKYNVFFPIQTLKKIVELSGRYIQDVPFPEKALRLLEEAAVNFGSREISMIMPEQIEELVTKKTKVPVGEAETGEKEKLLNLETFLHQRIVDQEEAITAVANALRRVRAGITSGKRPVGVFLFLGPTGVGKTETAKTLAESYFGSEENMARLDMSEYQDPSSIDRLLGTEANPDGVLTKAIIENPFSLILLDEMEKADKNILNVFLQVFEDGRLTTVRGKVVDFTNTIIIATSNAGSEYIREQVAAGKKEIKEGLINLLQQKAIFTPEFLNRFDGVITFKPLTPEQISQVAKLMIADINKRLAEKKIKVEVDDAALAQLVKLGFDPQFGARPMRRVITEKIENLLAKKMLEGTVQEGQTLNITLADIA